MSLVESPRLWYMAWNFALVTYAIVVALLGLVLVLLGFLVLLYLIGPGIVARGLQNWSESIPSKRTTISPTQASPQARHAAQTMVLMGQIAKERMH